MAQESRSPVSFRLTADDRRLIETVAAYREQSVSDFLRSVVLEVAHHIVRTEGEDKILRKLRENSVRLSGEKHELYERAIGQVGSR